MAIDTDNEKLAVMEWDNFWEPGIPMVSTSFATQAHQQQLILGNPSPAFASVAAATFVEDSPIPYGTIISQGAYTTHIRIGGR